MIGFDLSRNFISHDAMVNHVKFWADQIGFRIVVHPKLSFKQTNWPFHNEEFVANTSMRGHIYCSSKSEGRAMGSHCCFKLVYRVTNGAYVWNANNCNLSHSHPIAPKPMTFDGRTEVNIIGELTDAEERFIKEQTLSRTNVPNLQVSMEREFPNRSYDYELLRRVQDKFLDEKYGPDRNQLHDLFRKGDAIQQHGGIFLVDPCHDDFGIESIHFQPSLMRKYANLYAVNQFKMADGTHHLTRHNSTAIVWICVDGLLRTKYIGMTYAFSEHHAPIVRGAKLFFPGDGTLVNSTKSLAVGEFAGFFDPVVDNEVTLDHHQQLEETQVDSPNAYSQPINTNFNTTSPKHDSLLNSRSAENETSTSNCEINVAHVPEKSVLMTDEGSAFPLVCAEMGWEHLLDRKHFTDQIQSS